MKPADIVVIFLAAGIAGGIIQALRESIVGDFVAGFFESVVALFTKQGRRDLKTYGFMGSKRR